ncbi:MAG TPA: hypothetical protein VFV19_13850 [Candidatus Polarisedimenticolaceae bacterium]|nr:hypothetical protein [Candidatus Polarisedimenticolaceae bacterium]
MARFLIEFPHEADGRACVTFVRLALKSGSHFLTQADWGCKDGVHSGWVVIDADSKEEAQLVLPPPFRAKAKIIALTTFTLADFDEATGRQI